MGFWQLMSIFYLGLNPRYQSYTWLPDKLNVMYSAGGFWSQDLKQWRKKYKFTKSSGLRFLDSGGFTLLNQFGDYPFSTVEYMNLVAYLKPDYYAVLDYPCEPEITRRLGAMTNKQRINKTVANTKEILDWTSHVPGRHVPVIQGYTLEEYKYCIDLHHRAGTITNYMAVGSMCRRLSAREIHNLITGIFEHAQQAGIKKLHYFGLKLSPILIDLAELIYSRDSAVILDSYSSKQRALRNGRRFPKGQEEKKEAFNSFIARLDNLNLSYRTKESPC